MKRLLLWLGAFVLPIVLVAIWPPAGSVAFGVLLIALGVSLSRRPSLRADLAGGALVAGTSGRAALGLFMFLPLGLLAVGLYFIVKPFLHPGGVEASPPASASVGGQHGEVGGLGPWPSAVSGNLAPEDVGFIDKRGGWGWSDRCYRHYLAGRMELARAACERGMAMDPASPEPKAPLLYNLGLIAKATGDTDGAVRFFRQSLSIRPNDEVRRALDAMQ